MTDAARLLGAFVLAAKGTGNPSPPRWDSLGKAQRFTGGKAGPSRTPGSSCGFQRCVALTHKGAGGQGVLLLCEATC